MHAHKKKKSKTFTFWQISQKTNPDSKAIYIATKAVSWYQFDDRTIDAIKTSFQVHKCKTSSESVIASGKFEIMSLFAFYQVPVIALHRTREKIDYSFITSMYTIIR